MQDNDKLEKNCSQVLDAVEMFLNLIQGRKFKYDLNVSGKLDVVVAQ